MPVVFIFFFILLIFPLNHNLRCSQQKTTQRKKRILLSISFLFKLWFLFLQTVYGHTDNQIVTRAVMKTHRSSSPISFYFPLHRGYHFGLFQLIPFSLVIMVISLSCSSLSRSRPRWHGSFPVSKALTPYTLLYHLQVLFLFTCSNMAHYQVLIPTKRKGKIGTRSTYSFLLGL